MHYRCCTVAILFCFLSDIALAQTVSRTQVVQATYRIGGNGSLATCCIVSRAHPTKPQAQQLLLVTAAHVLEKIEGEQATLSLRSMDDEGETRRTPQTFQIRKDGKALWAKHPKLDVVVIELPRLEGADTHALPIEVLATEADWKKHTPEPGDLVRCVGFPHAAHFDPSPAGYPLVRLGCLAGFPLLPLSRYPMFLVDFNTFEGDSGGTVLYEFATDAGPTVKIIGIIHGQHFLDEKYDLIYRKGLIRKRLGLSIIVNSQAVIDTIDQLPNEPE